MPTYDVQVKDGRIEIESVSDLLHHMGIDRHMAALTLWPDYLYNADEDAEAPALFLDIDAIDRLVAVLGQVRKDLVNVGASP